MRAVVVLWLHWLMGSAMYPCVRMLVNPSNIHERRNMNVWLWSLECSWQCSASGGHWTTTTGNWTHYSLFVYCIMSWWEGQEVNIAQRRDISLHSSLPRLQCQCFAGSGEFLGEHLLIKLDWPSAFRHQFGKFCLYKNTRADTIKFLFDGVQLPPHDNIYRMNRFTAGWVFRVTKHNWWWTHTTQWS